MPLDRRQLLGLGAATGVCVVASACRPPGSGGHGYGRREDARPGRIQDSSPTGAPEAPGPVWFAGQPPTGHVYYGASLEAGRSLAGWEKALGLTLALHRSYFAPDENETRQLIRRCRKDLRHGRLPHVSMKPPSTWRNVATGRHDRWLADLLRQLGKEDAPVFLTLHHEPENDAGDAGMRAPDYTAMQRRAIRMAADLAPQVTIVPLLQHWTFEPKHVGADPEPWIVHEAAVLGFDVYNPWSPTNNKLWRAFGDRVEDVIGWFGDTPIAIGEYGCREDPEDPGRAADWLRDAAEYARTHNIVSMSYFNSGVHAPDGTLELSGETEQAFADLLGSDWVARPQ